MRTHLYAFHHTFTPIPDQIPASTIIMITADNEHTLYVNGVTLGSGTNSKVAQRYTVIFATPASEVVVLTTNTGGVLVEMEINMQPSGRTNCTYVLTDADARLTAEVWKSTKGSILAGFEQLGFDDSAWPITAAEEEYVAGPTWGTVTIATVSASVII
ncbi:hypothetical protein FB451DRAFT_1391891 [Mycena latifolia]|nr:hypothetical protein FB451DRAFT_1391891 [Mycena latifolia]